MPVAIPALIAAAVAAAASLGTAIQQTRAAAKARRAAGRETEGEAAQRELLEERLRQDPNALIAAENERILDAARRAQRQEQSFAAEQLIERLSDVGALESGLAPKALGQLSQRGEQDILNLAAQLAGRSEQARQTFRSERERAAAALAGLDTARRDRILGVQRATGGAQIATLGALGQLAGTVAGQLGTTQQQVAQGNDRIERLLEALERQNQTSPQGFGFDFDFDPFAEFGV